MTAIVRLIEFLRDAHRADIARFASFGHAVETLPRIQPSEAGAACVGLAAAAKIAVKQLAQVHVSAQPALRMAILSLSDALQQQLNAGSASPYYLREGT